MPAIPLGVFPKIFPSTAFLQIKVCGHRAFLLRRPRPGQAGMPRGPPCPSPGAGMPLGEAIPAPGAESAQNARPGYFRPAEGGPVPAGRPAPGGAEKGNSLAKMCVPVQGAADPRGALGAPGRAKF